MNQKQQREKRKEEFEVITRIDMARRLLTPPFTEADVARVVAAIDGRVSDYRASGAMLLQNVMFDSSAFGQLVVLPYGGAATFRVPPDTPIMVNGQPSSMSQVVAISPNEDDKM